MSDAAVMQLISAIKIRPQIYKMKAKSAGNKEITDRLWAEVAFEMQHSVPDCRRKWSILRNCYARSLRQERTHTVVKKIWYLQKELSFLKKYIHPQKRRGAADRDRDSPELVDEPSLPQESCSIDIESSSSLGPVDVSSLVTYIEEPVLEIHKTEDEFLDEPQDYANYVHKISDEEESNCSKISIKSSPIPPEISVVELHKPHIADEPSNNSNQLFLTSLLPDLNSLSERKQRIFKRKTIELLEQLFEDGEYGAKTMAHCQPPASNIDSVSSTLPTVQVTAHHYDPPLVFTVTHKDEKMT